MFKIYVDGSSDYNKANLNGDGGWALVVVNNENIIDEDFGFLNAATSSRAEITAGLYGLEYIFNNGFDGAEIYSDSTYFVNSYNKWVENWEARGWVKSDGDEVNHKDLMEKLIDLKYKTKARVSHVKGHNGNIYNERADELAELGRQNSRLK